MNIENFFICLCFCAVIWAIQDHILRLVKDNKNKKRGEEIEKEQN